MEKSKIQLKKSVKLVTKNIEIYAEDVYLKDSTGENFIENIVNVTNFPKIFGRIFPESLKVPILEMGFGEGAITLPLLNAGCIVEIIEGSSKLCESARLKFGDSVTVHCELFENFKPTERFQTVLSLHVLEHVDSPSAVVDKIYDWLKPGGQVIVVVPNAEALHRQLAVMMGLQSELNSLSVRDEVVGHQRVMTLKEISNLFERSGFKIVEKFGFFLKTIPNSMMVNYPPDLIRALTNISCDLKPDLMANVGIVAVKR